MTDLPGNGWTKDKGRIETLLDIHTDQLNAIDRKAWAIFLATLVAFLTAVASWAVPHPETRRSEDFAEQQRISLQRMDVLINLLESNPPTPEKPRKAGDRR